MVKKENVQNASNSLLQTATNRKLGASRLALTAFRSGARPPVKRVRVKSGDSRVSDLTVSVAENVLPAVVHEIHVGDIDVDSSILGMSLNSSGSSVSGQGKKKTTQSIGRAVKTTPQPRAYVAPSQIATKRPAVKKSMDLQNGIKFVAPSPMTLDRVQVQMGQERNAPESREYKLQQEEVREKQENELIRQEAEEMKLQLKKQIEEALGEGFEAQLEDFDTKRVANPVAAAAVKKKSLVKKIFSKIRHKSPGKLGEGKPKPITAAEARMMARKALMDASKQRRLQGMQGATMINNQYLAPRFPISEIVTHAKDDSISDLDASVRRFPVNEIVTNGLEQARDDETISTLGTPQIFDKLDIFLDQRDRTPIENKFARQPGGDTLLMQRGASPFDSQESGQQFLKLLEATEESRLRHRLGSALVDQMDSVSALSNHADATAATDDTGAIEVVMGRCNPTSVDAHKDPKTGQIVVKRMSPVDCALAAICAPPVAINNALSNPAKNVNQESADMPSVLKSSGPLSPVREEMRSPSSGPSPSSANTSSPRRAALSPTSKFNFAIDEAIRKVQTQMKRNDMQVGQEVESINAVVDSSMNRFGGGTSPTNEAYGKNIVQGNLDVNSDEDSDRYSIPDLETDKKNQLLAQNVSADFVTSFARMGSDLCNPTANQTSSNQNHNRKHPRVNSSGIIDLTAIESGTFVEDDLADAFVGEEGHTVHWEDQQAFQSPRRDNAFRFDDLMDIAESKLASSNEGMGSDDRYSVENDISPRQVILGQHVDGNSPDRRVPIVRGIDIRASNRRSTNEATPKASGASKSPKKRETVIDGGLSDNEVEIYYNPTCESIQEAVNADGVLKTLMNSFSFRSGSIDQTSPKSREGDKDLAATRGKADLDTVKQSSRRKVSPRSRSRKPAPGDLRSPSQRHNTEEPSFLPSSPNERSTATSNAFAGFFSDGLFDLLSGDDSTVTKEAILTSRGESGESGEPILSQGTTEMGGKSYEDGLSQTSTAASSTAIIKEGGDPKIGMMCGAVPLYLLYLTKPTNDGIDEKAARRKESESRRQESSPTNLASARTNPRISPGKLPTGKTSPPRQASRTQQKEGKSYPDPKTGSSYDSSVQREEGSGTYGNPFTVPTDEDAECKENNNSKPETTSTSPRNAQTITVSPTRKQNESPLNPTENRIPTNQRAPSKKIVKERRGAPIPDDTQQSRSRTALVRNEGGLNSSLPTDGAGAKNIREGILLDHDDAYWDTLSTIASTRDRSIEKPLKKVNPKPGPIPVEITMKMKSEADEAKSSSLNKQNPGCSNDPNEKIYEKVLSPSQTNAPQAAVQRQEGDLDRGFTKEDIESKENNKSINVVRVSRFGSGSGDDPIHAPPSRSLSGLPGKGKEQANSDSANSKSSRVANLIAKFEAARTELKGKLGVVSGKKQKTMIHARSQDDHGKSSSQVNTQSHMDTGGTANGVSNRSVSWGYEEIFEPIEPRQTETKPQQSWIHFNKSGGKNHKGSYATGSNSGDAYNDVPLSYSLSEGHMEGAPKEIQPRSSDPFSGLGWNPNSPSSGNSYAMVNRSLTEQTNSFPINSISSDPWASKGSDGYMGVQGSYSNQENGMALAAQTTGGLGIGNHTTESSGSEGYIPVARSYSALRGGPSTPHSSGSEGYEAVDVSRSSENKYRPVSSASRKTVPDGSANLGLQNPAYYSSGSEGHEPVSRSYSERGFVDRTKDPVALDRATTHSGGSGGYYPDPRSYSTHDSHDRANMLKSGRNGDFVPLEGKFSGGDLPTSPQDTFFSRENLATRSSGSEGLRPLERSYSPVPVRGSIPMQNDRNKGFEGDFDGSSSRSDDSPYSLYEKLPDTISPRPEHDDGEVLGDKKISRNSNPLPSLSQDWALPQTGDSRAYQGTNGRVPHEQSNQRSPHGLFESKYEHTKESLRRNGSPLGNMSSSSQSDFSSGSEDLRGNTPQLDGARSSRHDVLEGSSEGRSDRDGQVPPEIIQKPLLIAAAAGKGLMAAASAALFANRDISSSKNRSVTPSRDEKNEYKSNLESKVEILGIGDKNGHEVDKQTKTPPPLVVDDEPTKNAKETKDTKSSKVIDLTEREDTNVKSLTIEEEQNLITRTLELSKAILSSVNAQSATMSDEEIAKSILSLESEDIARSLLSLETNDGFAKGTTPNGMLSLSPTRAGSKPCPANVTVPISVTVQSPGKGSTTLNHSIQSLLKTDRVVHNLDQESTGGTTPSISLSTASQDSPVDINALFSKYDDVAHHLIKQNDQLKTIAKDDFSDSEHTSDILNKLQDLREQRSRAMSRFKAVHGHGTIDSGSSVITEDRDPPVSTSLTSNSQRERNRLTRYTSDNGSTQISRLESSVEKPRSKSSSRGYMFERTLNVDERQRAKSVDRSRLSDTHDSRDIESVSTSSCSTRTTASKKARDLRKQLDEALRTSQQIRQSQEKLGIELRSFKQRFYDRNNELEDQAFQAMGGMN